MIFLEVDPNVVKPGWTPLIITILLAAAIALLMLSMRRQMRKVRVPHRDEVGGTGSAAAASDQPADDDSADSVDPDAKSADRPAADSTTRPGT